MAYYRQVNIYIGESNLNHYLFQQKGAKVFQGTGGCLLFLNLPTAFRDA